MSSTDLAIVTGATGNLGRAVCALLERRGQRVARVERARVVHDAQVFDIDLDDGPSVQRAFAALAAGGPIGAVVHTVGAFRASGPIERAGDADFLELYRTNVLTTLHVLQAAIPILRAQKRGRIAVVASADAEHGRAHLSAYGASKAAQLRLIESAAQELTGSGVSLNAVLPGTMDTPQNRQAMPSVDPAGWVTLAEVAEVLSFLVSDAASGVHGQALRVARG